MKNFKMATLVLVVFSFFFSNVSVFAGKKVKSKDEKVLIKIGDEKVTLKDLEQAYLKNPKKNLAITDLSKDSLMDFINLYVNYRLKVQEAYNKGLDKEPSVVSEIEQNRNLISDSYYFDKTLVEPNVNELLERRKTELELGVIFFAHSKNNTDTVESYNKAITAITALNNGEDFLDYGAKNADDKVVGGKKHFITGGRIKKQIEDFAYNNLKIGDYNRYPIKTKYGYFIIKLYAKDNRVKVKPSHILFSENIIGPDSLKTIAKANEVLARLKKGESFEKLAKEFSDDKATAVNGGYLGSYYSRSTGFENLPNLADKDNKTLVPEFEEALFNLKDGENSGLVYTNFGIHIVKRDSTKTFTAEEERDYLKKFYKQAYFDEDKKAYLEELKHKYDFKANLENLKVLVSFFDTTKTTLDSNWAKRIDDSEKNKTIYSTPTKNITVGNLIDSVKIRKDLRAMALSKSGIIGVLEKFTSPELLALATKNLERDYPDFAQLRHEFVDGILLFKIEEQEVWNKMKFDTVKAREFWESTKNNYQTETQYSYSEIYVLSDSLSKNIYAKIKAGGDFEKLAEENTQRSGMREKKGRLEGQSAKNNKIVKQIIDLKLKEGEYSEPIKMDKGYSIFMLHRIIEPRVKTFEEAISDFAPAFQDKNQKNLTETWIQSLKEKTKVTIDEKMIDAIYKNK